MLIFCEENLHGFISQPSNTISALPFVIIGILIFGKNKLIGLGTLFLGFTTILFHATDSLVGQYLDLFSMLLLLIIFVFKAYPFRKINKKYISISVLLFVIAFVFWIGDISRILCIPDNHILTGHGIWHILTAISIWLVFMSLPL